VSFALISDQINRYDVSVLHKVAEVMKCRMCIK